MDLYAYAQIGDLSNIALENGIDVPRLRGYRLMKDEEQISDDEINRIHPWFFENLILSWPMFDPNACLVYDDRRNDLINYYAVNKITDDGNLEPVDFRWDRIRSRKTRKRLKTMMRNQRNRQRKQYEIWNKYCGRDDILYIHARLGGKNWKYYDCNHLIAEPWFIERVDDNFDDTYCDIYARIKPLEEK